MTQKQPIVVLFYIYVKPRAQKVKTIFTITTPPFPTPKIFHPSPLHFSFNSHESNRNLPIHEISWQVHLKPSFKIYQESYKQNLKQFAYFTNNH